MSGEKLNAAKQNINKSSKAIKSSKKESNIQDEITDLSCISYVKSCKIAINSN